MQTFLPYPDFEISAAVLDSKRLGKQRVEAYQIIRSISVGDGWSHHPIVKMWTGFENALKLYSNSIVKEWVKRGYRNNMEIYNLNGCGIDLPWWLGKEEFHKSHRAALLAKNFEHYSKFGWSEEPEIKYVWYAKMNSR
jgi:hypothetical protein